ncbi:DNA-binding FrmR family transcriptional regulator [Streptohalobacillus salinus]|uniref:DNA-binding FrmR family transcriptional regulator n=1 Tax=Streptohalobacillus salinus TaxID=621096 RepID=A0A2V3WHQ5_9BACI|nr:metal-sensitive transcriptional regulator [Streptohalobacillus salinus]PXW93044.1 DNA-binding FrmR family transcriptional regulator [Streptohalobacillus salinus]
MDYTPQVKNRMKRIEGQVRGILKMMEDEKDCKEVITQMSAVRTAIDRTMGLVVSSNLVNCVIDAEANGVEDPQKYVEDAVELLVKSR